MADRVGAHCFDHPVDECRWAIGRVFYACRGANVLGTIITVHDGVWNVDSATL